MIATVLVDTNVFTARLRERSPLASSFAKYLFGQRIAVAPQTVAEARSESRAISHPLPAKCLEIGGFEDVGQTDGTSEFEGDLGGSGGI